MTFDLYKDFLHAVGKFVIMACYLDLLCHLKAQAAFYLSELPTSCAADKSCLVYLIGHCLMLDDVFTEHHYSGGIQEN